MTKSVTLSAVRSTRIWLLWLAKHVKLKDSSMASSRISTRILWTCRSQLRFAISLHTRFGTVIGFLEWRWLTNRHTAWTPQRWPEVSHIQFRSRCSGESSIGLSVNLQQDVWRKAFVDGTLHSRRQAERGIEKVLMSAPPATSKTNKNGPTSRPLTRECGRLPGPATTISYPALTFCSLSNMPNSFSQPRDCGQVAGLERCVAACLDQAGHWGADHYLKSNPGPQPGGDQQRRAQRGE